jgi:hypothetical protein
MRHDVDDLAPTLGIKSVLKRELVRMAAAAVVGVDLLLPHFRGGVLGEAVHPFDAGQLLLEILQRLELQSRYRLYLATPSIHIQPGPPKSLGLGPQAVFEPLFQRWENIDPLLVGKYGRHERLARTSNGDRDAFQGFPVRGFYRSPELGSARCVL